MKRLLIAFALLCCFLVAVFLLLNASGPHTSALPPEAADRVDSSSSQGLPAPSRVAATDEDSHRASFASALPAQEQVDYVSATYFYQALRIPVQDYSNTLRKAEAQLAEIVAKDKADGLNAAVREKEDRLRELARALRPGISLTEAAALMGQPDLIQSIHTASNAVTFGRHESVTNVPAGIPLALSWWPRVGVAFDGRNGQGYKVLYLLYDGNHTLERWFWEWPKPNYGGTFNGMARMKDYWNGTHEHSDPPPDGTSW